MIVVAKSKYKNHTHSERGVKIQFDKTGLFRTEDPKEIAILEKFNGMGSRWSIVDRVNSKAEKELAELRKRAVELKIPLAEKTGLEKLKVKVAAAEKELAEEK